MSESITVQDFSEKAYLDYSMYVILNRALPHISDGLKPVQRRIIYAMHVLGLKNEAKFKKSARTVGDVLGKFHPHGDSACYEAMVLMAQPFSFRYPLIEGQGNWGSVDDTSSFAAMRYTEAKLAKISQLLLTEVGQGIVNWKKNFDGTMDEPELLPARLPFALLNGASGIAVGMATDIPPHNLKEVASACITLLKNSRTSLDDLLEIIKGPDFPLNSEIITSREEIKEIYTSGTGTIKARACYTTEKNKIRIHALPYQTSSAKIVMQIASLMQSKKLPMIEDVRDESDHTQDVCVVITYNKRQKKADEIMDHLFTATDLEKSFRINLNLISNKGLPRVYDLKSLLLEWLDFRKQSVTLRSNHRRTLVKDRLRVIAGFIIVFDFLDEVLHIIRHHDNPSTQLKKKFKLTDEQVHAILETKLRRLAKLEEKKLLTEQKELLTEKKNLTLLLSSSARLKTLITNEIQQDIKDFGDERRCNFVARSQAQAFSKEQLIEKKGITIILSQGGWIRQANGYNFNHSNLTYKSTDTFLHSINAQTNLPTVFIDTKGRVYTTESYDFPSSRSAGEPLSARINLGTGCSLAGLVNGNDSDIVALATSKGFGYKTAFSNLKTRNKRGKIMVTVSKGIAICPATLNEEHLALITQQGKLLIVKTARIPKKDKGRGERLITIPASKRSPDRLSHIIAINHKQSLQLTFLDGKTKVLKPTQLTEYYGRIGQRGFEINKTKKKITNAIIKR